MSTLTAAAKSKLASVIRSFRGTQENPNGGLVLKGLRDRAESEYQLSLSQTQADLPEAQRVQRRRLESWLMEQARADLSGTKVKDRQRALEQSKARHLAAAIKLAGATLVNRLVVIRLLEAQGMSKPAVVTGGWDSAGYREFRDEFGPALCKDESEGYGFLLKLLYDELALELPGLFGLVGLVDLFPVAVSVLRAVVEALNDPLLESAWTDDTTLGWVYQYWNDPEREALDKKLDDRGKVAPHEIASKTQMFTERYMVEWLLQNSLGQQWLAICDRNGWTPQVVADGTLNELETRRADWRERREKGEVALDALMPIESEQAARWKYWVKQPELDGEGVPGSIKELKIFDPACGSGHFLVIAFDLLLAFYAEEARHRGVVWTAKEIVESILENNLFGLDLDPRAVQIAAAALHLKAKGACREARPKVLNLVASNLNLAAFPVDDPARVELRAAVEAETGIPGALTDEIVEALKGADAWGSLLQVDWAVEVAIGEYEKGLQKAVQGNLLESELQPERALPSLGEGPEVRAILLAKLEAFLTRCTRSDDLGLRLRGEQLAAGVRFIRMVRGVTYDLVVGNPPYQGTSKLADSYYVKRHYKEAKADLYAAFLQRGIQFVKPGGLSALLTMRNWMFISQYSKIREHLIEAYDLRLIGDLETGAFEEVSAAQVVLSVAMTIFCRATPRQSESIALQIAPGDLKSEGNTNRKRAAMLAQVGRFEFETNRFAVIKEKPLIYWWDRAFLKRYAETPKLGNISPAKKGACTSDNMRFIAKPWEVNSSQLMSEGLSDISLKAWAPYIMGAKDKVWLEGLDNIIRWKSHGLEVKTFNGYLYGSYTRSIQNQDAYFVPGVAFSTIGASFSARKHRYRSVIDTSGSSTYPHDVDSVCALMNSLLGKTILNGE